MEAQQIVFVYIFWRHKVFWCFGHSYVYGAHFMIYKGCVDSNQSSAGQALQLIHPSDSQRLKLNSYQLGTVKNLPTYA
jgi:hypothetical protein